MNAAEKPRRGPPPQFTLLGMLVVMLVVGAAGASAHYLMQGSAGDVNLHLVGMLAVLAGPPLLVVAVSLFVALVVWLRGP